jgi:hypothetical protein
MSKLKLYKIVFSIDPSIDEEIRMFRQMMDDLVEMVPSEVLYELLDHQVKITADELSSNKFTHQQFIRLMDIYIKALRAELFIINEKGYSNVDFA